MLQETLKTVDFDFLDNLICTKKRNANCLIYYN